MPENTEEFIEYLQSVDRLDEAANLLVKVINSEEFVSRNGKSKHQVNFNLITFLDLLYKFYNMLIV